jgi:magnesium transporter
MHLLPNKSRKKIRKSPGLAPGTLVYTGTEREDLAFLSLFKYTESELTEVQVAEWSEVEEVIDSSNKSWLNVTGIHDIPLIESIGKLVGLHPLIMEDIVHPEQRAKFEVYDDHIYIVAKMIYQDSTGNLTSEQISIVVGKTYVISFQERPQDVFEPIRERLRSGKGLMRKMGCDYLAYALLDLIVDHYFIALEEVGTRLETFEEVVLEHPSKQTMSAIREQKKALIAYRRDIWPLREVISGLTRDDSGLIQKKTVTYLRDVYDHTIQVIDIVESYRDLLSGLTDLYLSALSHRMNEVMQVLTIIGSIFIPITFIAGVYGMNFQVMPELSWKYGYFASLGLMLATALGLVFFFKRKKWL